MKRNFCQFWGVLFLVVLFVFCFTVKNYTSWEYGIMDWSTNGEYTSIAVDLSKNPHISYSDDTNGDLKGVKISFYPELSWTGEAGYTTDGLNPETGKPDDTYVYRIKYTDGDNDPPKAGYPRVYIKKDGLNITGSPFTMNEVDPVDTTYTDGKLYTYNKVLTNAGSDYTYYFEAYDVTNKVASGEPTNPIDAPVVFTELTITTDKLKNVIINTIYSDILQATGGITPYIWTITAGALPDGLILNLTTGEISGTPTKLGDFAFTVQVKDSSPPQQTKTKDFTIKIIPPSLDSVNVYPNPWKPDMGVDVITFANLTENVKIRIYTISDELVIEIKPDKIDYLWNLKNEAGKEVSSGVYLYIISNDKGETKTGKFVIIR